MTVQRIRSCLFVFLPALLGTCTKSSSSSTIPPATAETRDASEAETSTSEATEPGAPGVPWAEKTFEQRQEWMGVVFYPAMKSLFQTHDAIAFKTFKCQTCHGDDMKERKFEMPSDSIFPLDPERPVESAMEYDEAITKFMIEVVVPESAKLLDTQPYNPETGEGFGCFDCHPKA